MEGIMKRITVLLLITVLALLCFAIPVAADGEPQAAAIYGTPESIDGVLDSGWKNANSYVSDHHDSADPTPIGASWKIMYDETYIYTFVEVTDPTIGDAAYEETAYGDLWTTNTIHLMYDLGNEKSEGYDTNDFYFDFNVRGFSHGHYINQNSFWKFKVVVTDTGYNLEAALDIGIYSGFKAETGSKFGLEVWVNDNICDGNGRRDFVSWSGYGDTWCNPSHMGTVTLGEKPDTAGNYSGVTGGENIVEKGATLTAITNAIGKDVSVIVDGNKTAGQNVDTWQCQYSDDLGVWFGATFEKEYDVSTVIFWEGGHWGDGGWFGSAPKLQILVGEEWKDANASIDRAYPADNRDAQGETHESYIFTLSEAVTCKGVRIVGANNSLAGHASVSEIEVYTPFPTPVQDDPGTGTGTGTETEAPATGDTSFIAVVLMLIISFAAVFTAVQKRKKI